MYKYRILEPFLQESLATFRVVSLTGARQVGKTTLVRRISDKTGRHYVTLEDLTVRAAAQADPDGWLAANPPPLTLDEIQHVPDLLRAIKMRVDEHAEPGQYLLTGSALWLSMPRISESLAGRVAMLEMWPFSAAERTGRQPPPLADLLFGSADPSALATGLVSSPSPEDLMLRGGFPEASAIAVPRQRSLWFESYLKTYLQRDVLDFVRIEHLSAYSRLIRLLAARTAQVLNVSSLARDLGLPQPTVRRYAEWLRLTFQAVDVPPYSTSYRKRLVRSAKHYWADTGMTAALMGLKTWKDVEIAQMAGHLTESWVAEELLKWRATTQSAEVFFWRTHDGGEADFVIEHAGKVSAIEVKCGQRVDVRDLRGLRECAEALGDRFHRGIVFYGGKDVQGLAEGIFAVPLRFLFGTRDVATSP